MEHWTKSLKPGDEVTANFPITLGANRGDPVLSTLVVAKAGKKWIYLKYEQWAHAPYRVEIGTDDIDGGGYASPGSIYPSRESFEAHRARGLAWDAFRRAVDLQWRPLGDHIPTEAIYEAARLIGLDIAPAPKTEE